jgi:mannose-6-phosphate isomerase
MKPYPLRFKEIIRNYGFGSRWIPEAFEKNGLPSDQRIAETWEVCDRRSESSLVINGHLAGKNLRELIQQNPEGLLGTQIVAKYGDRFPLLIKILDVTHPLGEQVHHNDELARKYLLDDPGKTEAWYMIQTRPKATIHCGQLDDTITQDQLRKSLSEGEIRKLMRPYPVKPGDSFLLYAGTMHYSSGGVLFYEIMQNSDVYIGLRKPDEALSSLEQRNHIDKIMEGIHLEPGFECKTAPIQLENGVNKRWFILACQHFALERIKPTQSYSLLIDGRHFHVLTVIEGACLVRHTTGDEVLRSGQSCLLPSALGGVQLIPLSTCSVLNAYVPDLDKDVIQPLKQAGIPKEGIEQLGGNTRLNPIKGLLGN